MLDRSRKAAGRLKVVGARRKAVLDRRALWAITEMERRIADVTTETLAASVNLSRSRFAHLFTEQLGVSPARYLHALRMERARVLLERTFLTVRQVMTEVGITDASHFSRDFRQYHGVAPRDVRRDAASSANGGSPFLARHLGLVEAANDLPLR